MYVEPWRFVFGFLITGWIFLMLKEPNADSTMKNPLFIVAVLAGCWWIILTS